MALAGLLLFFIVIVFIAARWYSRRSKLKAKLPKQEDDHMPGLFRTIWPIIGRLAVYNRLLPLSIIRKRYANQIERAGLRFEMSADEFLAIKEIAVLVMAVVALLVYFAVVQNLLVVAALIFIGLVYPDMNLSTTVSKRAHACSRALPSFLDLLGLAVEAGMGFDAAVRKLTEVLEPGPLTWEFESFLRSMNVGKPRAEALRDMARKLSLPDFTTLANTIIHALETGASMATVLRVESHEMLLRRFERAEKMAGELPVKMLFPLFVFVFPATFLMLLGPLYFQFMASGAGGAL